LLAELLAQRDRDRPAEHVGNSARCESHHHAHRLVRVVALRVCQSPRQGKSSDQDSFHQVPFRFDMACHSASTSRLSTFCVMKTRPVSAGRETGRRRSNTWRTPWTATVWPLSRATMPFTRNRSAPRRSTSSARKRSSRSFRGGPWNFRVKVLMPWGWETAEEKTWSVPNFSV